MGIGESGSEGDLSFSSSSMSNSERKEEVAVRGNVRVEVSERMGKKDKGVVDEGPGEVKVHKRDDVAMGGGKVRKGKEGKFSLITILGYERVFAEVNSYLTQFQTHESVKRLKKGINMTISHDAELLIVESCGTNKCVFMRMAKDVVDRGVEENNANKGSACEIENEKEVEERNQAEVVRSLTMTEKETGTEAVQKSTEKEKWVEDLNKHVGYLSSKSEENKALRNRVADLEQQVKDIGIEVEELVFENKVVKENLAITKDKVADLENTIEKLKSEM
ncbi:hypothetical protein JHK85_011010 [Glycine max]|nr:hypothetical protein JHK85_011010 [Glycine max]KAG5066969.1 hypothetical protein JHK86_010700 [Glycine max]